MRFWSILTTCTIGFILGALITGCSSTSQSVPLPPASSSASIRTSHARPALSYVTMYSFYADSNVTAGLIKVGNVFYGTSASGNGVFGNGYVYSISAKGTVTVLHAFGFGTSSGSDGKAPLAGLTDVNGTLYGTTSAGGAYGDGTVYSITTTGTETVLHSFSGGSDGSSPQGGSLLNVGGTLYGTTLYGGTGGSGTAFKITTGGTETVLHSFSYGPDGLEGAFPYSGLINVNGTLYGTTEMGYFDAGTVYSMTKKGATKRVYGFDTGLYGFYPIGGLVNVNGTLYGTTHDGGVYKGGTVYSLTTAGVATVLHAFGSGTDGSSPVASLVNVNGELYGTTPSGGVYNGGTIFSITTTGTEAVVYGFGLGTDGKSPQDALINVNGRLYGTTSGGGANGGGIAFWFQP